MRKNLLNRPYISAIKVITNPFSSFELIKEKGYGTAWQIVIPVFLVFLARIFSIVFSGFLFNTVKTSEVNLFIEFMAIVAIYVLFVFANKNFCDLIEGNGSMFEVALVTSFALLPYVFTTFINIILSNFFLLREASFMSIITTVGLLWSAIVGFVGLKIVHNYSFTKTVLTIFITALFMLFIAFLVAIIFIITQQLVLFFKDIYNELIFRM